MQTPEQQAMLASGKLVSISQAAIKTPYSAEYLSLLARKGRLDAVKIGRDWLTTQDAVVKYVRKQEIKHKSRLAQLKAMTQAGFISLNILPVLAFSLIFMSLLFAGFNVKFSQAKNTQAQYASKTQSIFGVERLYKEQEISYVKKQKFTEISASVFEEQPALPVKSYLLAGIEKYALALAGIENNLSCKIINAKLNFTARRNGSVVSAGLLFRLWMEGVSYLEVTPKNILALVEFPFVRFDYFYNEKFLPAVGNEMYTAIGTYEDILVSSQNNVSNAGIKIFSVAAAVGAPVFDAVNKLPNAWFEIGEFYASGVKAMAKKNSETVLVIASDKFNNIKNIYREVTGELGYLAYVERVEYFPQSVVFKQLKSTRANDVKEKVLGATNDKQVITQKKVSKPVQNKISNPEKIAKTIHAVPALKPSFSVTAEIRDYLRRLSFQTNYALYSLGSDMTGDLEAVSYFTNDFGRQIKYLAINFWSDATAPYKLIAQVAKASLTEQKEQLVWVNNNFKNSWAGFFAFYSAGLNTGQLALENASAVVSNSLIQNIGMLDMYARDNFDYGNSVVAVISGQRKESGVSGSRGHGVRDGIQGAGEEVLGIATKNTESNAPKPVAVSLEQQIKDIFYKYIQQGLFGFNASNYGPDGIMHVGVGGAPVAPSEGSQNNSTGIAQNSNGNSTVVVGGMPIVSYIPAYQPSGFSGTSLAGFGQLSAQNFNSQTISASGSLIVQGAATLASLAVSGNTVLSGELSAATATLTSLTVSGPVILNGSTTITGLTVTGFNPGLTNGSVTFQGASGLNEDNNNFYWDNITKQLGIGTSSPSTTLFVQGKAGVNPFSVASSTGTQLLTVLQNGNVGIGTESPTNRLVVHGNSGKVLIGADSVTQTLSDTKLHIYHTTANSRIQIGQGASNNLVMSWIYSPTPSNAYASISTYGGGNNLALQSAGGNVGIGTTSPSARLSVKGGGTTTGRAFAVSDSADTERFTILDNGNVGVGISTPRQLLDVAGNFLVAPSNVDIASGWDFNVGWTPTVGTTINDSDTFTTNATGGIFRNYFTIGKTYTITVNGNISTGSIELRNGNTGVAPFIRTGFGSATFTATDSNLYLRLTVASVADIDSIIIIEAEENSTFIVDISNGVNVGIGTTSPSARLSVKGGGTTTGRAFAVSDSAETERFTILDNGNVGIGTATPATALHIHSSSQPLIDALGMITAFTGDRARFAYWDPASPDYKVAFGSGWGSVQDFAIHIKESGNFTTATQLFTVKSSGNVGIGTIIPSSKLSVLVSSDDATSTSFQIGKGTQGNQLTILNSGDIGIGTVNPNQKLHINLTANEQGLLLNRNSITSGDYSSLLFGVTNAPQSGYIKGGILFERTGANAIGNLHFAVNNLANTSNVGLSDSKMVITSGGNVGIGTTSPSARLSVKGGGTTTGRAFAVSDSADTERFTILDNGNVGIGANAPISKLAIGYNGNASYSLAVSGSVLVTTSYTITGGAAFNSSGLYTATNNLELKTYDGVAVQTRLSINAGDGNVGIGTTSPSARLSVKGGGTTTGRAFAVSDSADTERFTILDNGNVGIGTVSPGAKLEVAGSIHSKPTSGTGLLGIKRSGDTNLHTINSIDNHLVFTTVGSGAGTYFITNGAERLRIDSAGNVGIGTTGPTAPLQVSNSSTTLVSAIFDNATAATALNNYNYLKLRVYNSGVINAQDVGIGGVSDSVTGGSRSTALALFYGNQSTGFTEGMRITGSGNVGIGTTSPSNRLQVVGNIVARESDDGFDAIRLAAGASSGNLMVYSGGVARITLTGSSGDVSGNTLSMVGSGSSYFSGNVGIGTTSPYAKLSVVGETVSEFFTATTTTGTSTLPNLFATNLRLSGRLYDSANSSGTNGMVLQTTGSGTEWVATSTLGFASSATAFQQGGNAFGTTATLGTTDNQNLSIITNNTAKMTVLANGNVGIGTTSPSQLLTVGNNDQFTVTSAGTVNAGRYTVNAVLTAPSNGLFAPAANSVALSTNSNERLRIDSTGNVGIGTTSPSARLSVKGGGTTTGRAFAVSDSADTERFTILDNGNVGVGTVSPSALLSIGTGSGTTAANGLNFGDTSANLYRSGAGTIKTDASSFSVGSGITMQSSGGLYASLGLLNGATSANARFIAANNGPYIDRTQNDAYPALIVKQAGVSSTGDILQLQNSGGTVVTVQQTGNVGIGTTSPQSILHVSGAGSQTITLQNTTGPTLTFVTGTSNPSINSTGGLYFNASTGNTIGFNINGDPKLFVGSTGNVGIGTTSPSARLSVKGGGTTTGRAFAVSDSADAERFTILDNGNVGILNTSPTARLSVYGISVRPFEWGNSSPLGLLSYSGSTPVIGSVGATDLWFTTNNQLSNPYLAIQHSTGNVGIGTTSPYAKLSVVGETVSEFFTATTTTGTSTLPNLFATNLRLSGRLYDSANSSGTNGMVLQTTGSGTEWVATSTLGFASSATAFQQGGNAFGTTATLGTTDNQNLSIITNNTAKMTVLANGNVGVGTTTPNSKLVVGGNIKIVGWGGGTGNRINFVTDGDSLVSYIRGGWGGYSYGTENPSLALNSSYTAFGRSDGSIIDMVIRTGNVGIGTTSPSARLSVKGGGTTTGRAFAVSDSADTERFTILDNGNVGIGTSSPSAPLTIQQTNNTDGFKLIGNYDPTTIFSFYIGDAGTNNPRFDSTKSMVFNASNIIYFRTGNGIYFNDLTPRTTNFNNGQMVLTSTGNVGVGTTSPTEKLSIGSVASGGNVKIANGWLCVDDNDTCTGATTAGTIYATNGTVSGGADVAENYPTQDKTLEPGDIVSVSADSPIHVTKSRIDEDSRGILGVVSTKPGVLLGHNGDFINASSVPVALVGRVPVKVTNENGNIKQGDYLTISKTQAGYAAKAIEAGYVIGQALENYNPSTGSGSNGSTILVFINKTYFVPKVAEMLQNGQNFTLFGEAPNLNNAYAFNNLVVINTMYVGKKLVVKEIIETVELIANIITAKEKVCIGQTCVTEEQLKAVLELLDGKKGSVAGASVQAPEPEAPAPSPIIPPSTPEPVIDPPAEAVSPPISEPAPSELSPDEVLPVMLSEPIPPSTE